MVLEGNDLSTMGLEPDVLAEYEAQRENPRLKPTALGGAEKVDEAALLKVSMDMITDYIASNPEVAASARGIGYDFGLDFATGAPTDSLDDAVSRMSEYWARNGMGQIRWRDRKAGLLAVKRHSRPVDRDHRERLCAFLEGMIEAVVNGGNAKCFRVEEARCGYCSGQACAFRISRVSTQINVSRP